MSHAFKRSNKVHATAPIRYNFALKTLLQQLVGAGIIATSVSVVAHASEVGVLEPVVVVGQSVAADGLQKPYAGGQVAQGGSLGVLGTTNVMSTPFSTTNYTRELIENQQARSVADVVTNDASVRSLTASGGFGDQFQIRGFTVQNEDTGINGLYGLAPTTRIPVEMVERVEVLKGPGTLANGIGPSGSVGGSINLVTKRAEDEPLTRLTTTYLSQSQLATHLDLGRRFGDDKEWGVRVNGVVRGGEGTIDNGKQEMGLATVGLDYRGRRLRWSMDAFSQRDEVREFRPQTSFNTTGMTQIPEAPDSRLNFYPGTRLDSRSTTALSKFEFDIDSSLMAYGGVGYSDFSYEQTFPSAVGGVNSLGNFTVRNAYYDYYSKTAVANAGLRKTLATGGVVHTLALGVDRLSQESGYFYATSATTAASSIYNPSALPTVSAARSEPAKSAENVLTSYALTDTMSFANDRLLLTLGLRHQTVEQRGFSTSTGAQTSYYEASAVSPLVGIVYKPLNNVSVYGNYTEGLTRGQIVSPTTSGIANVNAGAILSPYKSAQREAGVKVDWGKVMTSASVFQISRPNGQQDPTTRVYGYDGEQRNRGLELVAYGELQRGLRVMASAVFNDTSVTGSATGANNGKKAIGVPDRTFNFGVDWDAPWVPGLSFNGRVVNNSSTYYDAANTLTVPGWTRYDIGARYVTKVAGKQTVLRANIENLFDKSYWIQSGTYVTVSAPRTLVLSATVDF